MATVFAKFASKSKTNYFLSITASLPCLLADCNNNQEDSDSPSCLADCNNNQEDSDSPSCLLADCNNNQEDSDSPSSSDVESDVDTVSLFPASKSTPDSKALCVPTINCVNNAVEASESKQAELEQQIQKLQLSLLKLLQQVEANLKTRFIYINSCFADDEDHFCATLLVEVRFRDSESATSPSATIFSVGRQSRYSNAFFDCIVPSGPGANSIFRAILLWMCTTLHAAASPLLIDTGQRPPAIRQPVVVSVTQGSLYTRCDKPPVLSVLPSTVESNPASISCGKLDSTQPLNQVAVPCNTPLVLGSSKCSQATVENPILDPALKAQASVSPSVLNSTSLCASANIALTQATVSTVSCDDCPSPHLTPLATAKYKYPPPKRKSAHTDGYVTTTFTPFQPVKCEDTAAIASSSEEALVFSEQQKVRKATSVIGKHSVLVIQDGNTLKLSRRDEPSVEFSGESDKDAGIRRFHSQEQNLSLPPTMVSPNGHIATTACIGQRPSNSYVGRPICSQVLPNPRYATCLAVSPPAENVVAVTLHQDGLGAQGCLVNPDCQLGDYELVPLHVPNVNVHAPPQVNLVETHENGGCSMDNPSVQPFVGCYGADVD